MEQSADIVEQTHFFEEEEEEGSDELRVYKDADSLLSQILGILKEVNYVDVRALNLESLTREEHLSIGRALEILARMAADEGLCSTMYADEGDFTRIMLRVYAREEYRDLYRHRHLRDKVAYDVDGSPRKIINAC